MENNNLPVKAGAWKEFWLQPITLELTPYEKKVFTEFVNFWNQEVHIKDGNVILTPNSDLELDSLPDVNVDEARVTL